jgi:hypothetical protein
MSLPRKWNAIAHSGGSRAPLAPRNDDRYCKGANRGGGMRRREAAS